MAFATQEEAYEALGLTPPEPETQEEDVQTTETEPEQEPRQEQVEAPDEESAGEPEQEDPLEKLRRELTEQHQKELERQKADYKKREDERVAGMGLKNPYDDNKPITTVEEYEAFQSKHQDEQWNRICKQTGMTREALDALIAERPEVRKALEQQAQAQAAQEEAEQKRLQQKLNDDIASIAAECSEVTDIDSLVNHPSYPAVAAKMKQLPGLGVADAFFLVNRANLAAGRAAADTQRTRNNLAGKNHLQRTKGQEQTGPHISAEQEAWYRRLCPGATAEQIRQHFTKHHKGKEN